MAHFGKKYVSSTFVEKLQNLIVEEFWDFQTKHGIDDGGLMPDVEFALDERVEALVDMVDECLMWQLKLNHMPLREYLRERLESAGCDEDEVDGVLSSDETIQCMSKLLTTISSQFMSTKPNK